VEPVVRDATRRGVRAPAGAASAQRVIAGRALRPASGRVGQGRAHGPRSARAGALTGKDSPN